MTDLEAQLRQMLLAREPVEVEGLSARGQRVYRRQVRGSLMSGTRLAIPICDRLLGRAVMDTWLERWLDEAPPTTRLYWQLPLEFAQWCVGAPDHPHLAMPELIHWETLEVDILNAPDPSPWPGLTRDPAPDKQPALDPSARLCVYRHPVHRLDLDAAGWPEAAPDPVFLMAWRRDEHLRWRTLSAQCAQLTAHLVEHDAVLAVGLDFLQSLYGEIDRDALVGELAALVEGGALLGFRQDQRVEPGAAL